MLRILVGFLLILGGVEILDIPHTVEGMVGMVLLMVAGSVLISIR